MKTLFAAFALSAALLSAPAIAQDVPASGAAPVISKQAQCGALWRGNKATLAPVHGAWPRFWSACSGALKVGADPLKAPAKAKLAAAPAAAPVACTTDSDCEGKNPGL